MTFDELFNIFKKLLPGDSRPVVAYSGIWTIARAFEGPPRAFPQILLDQLLRVTKHDRTLLMPSYTSGFRDGTIDLDNEPGKTGITNELLRVLSGSRRTASAFFSFVAHGRQVDEVAVLRPVNAWGEGSLFEWIEQNDAHLLMIGLPWEMCSFLHRVEWLGRVPYRYFKNFEGQMIREGRCEPLKERLFIRSLDPLAENTWPDLDSILEKAGMQRFPVGQSHVAEIGALSLVESLMPIIKKDPFAFIKNPELWRER